MFTVGLTGGIACGKTLVRRELDRLGAATLDADDLAREAVQPGSRALEEIAVAFGREIIQQDGALDRRKLAEIVFRNPERRETLNAIVHPEVFRLQKEWLEDLEELPEEERPPFAVIDAALMIETGSYRRYDTLVVVDCAPGQQELRLMWRDRLSRKEARRRIESQWPIDMKKDFADYVIDNSRTPEAALEQVNDLYEELKRRAEKEAGEEEKRP